MNAADDVGDARLYRASGDLLPEIEAKLPLLVWHCRDGKPKEVRTRVLSSKLDELVRLVSNRPLERFQEWPQLLDGHLVVFLQPLNDAFLSYLMTRVRCYTRDSIQSTANILTLPRAVCRLLYLFCKVRGQKVIVRFLNNEPKYIEPMRECLSLWRKSDSTNNSAGKDTMHWEERYVMLLWLSHLMLAPFDLASISSGGLDASADKLPSLFEGLPTIANMLLDTALGYLYVPSKEREAASAMIVRLVLRKDMQERQLLPQIIDFATSGLLDESLEEVASPYKFVGLLSLLSGIMTVGSDDDLAAYLTRTFQVCLKIATSETQYEAIVRNSAPVRKLLIKTIRLIILHALSLSARSSSLLETNELNPMLEDSIQYLLDCLSDKDTPVRMSASKSLSIITLSLDPAMSAEIVQAVLDSLNENVLLEDSTGRTFAAIEVGPIQGKLHRKNLSAVDPLKWHGLMLTLAHLLFRRSPPPEQLSLIITALISGLEFEQRSNVGTSIGVGVRDAACFGIWALARKYSTNEIDLVDASELLPSLRSREIQSSTGQNTLQILARQLVLSACLDPSGNIRRGSSAALQELIGRHPDTIVHGIPLVQVVDYHAIARRSKAITEVAVRASELDPLYRSAVLDALLDWRGAKAVDADCRRWAAEATGLITVLLSKSEALFRCRELKNQIMKLRATNTGVNASSRHGLLLTLAADLRVLMGTSEAPRPLNDNGDGVYESGQLTEEHSLSDLEAIRDSILEDLHVLSGDIHSRVTRDLELAFEAISVMISSLAGSLTKVGIGSSSRRELKSTDNTSMMKMLPVLERCITGSEKDAVIAASTVAFTTLFRRIGELEQAQLLDRWLSSDQLKRSEYKCRGRIEAAGAVFSFVQEGEGNNMRSRLLQYLQAFIQGPWPIETKVNAMTALTNVLRMIFSNESAQKDSAVILSIAQLDELAGILHTGLTDYTIDQRGDIGSTLRLSSIEAVEAFIASRQVTMAGSKIVRPLIQTIGKLAVEKLDKVRFRAWHLLQSYWTIPPEFPLLTSEFPNLTDVSSTKYYSQLLELLRVDWMREHILLGLVSSAAAGTEDIGRASRSALTLHILQTAVGGSNIIPAAILGCLNRRLELKAASEDRDVVPTLELLAFLLEQGLLDASTQEDGSSMSSDVLRTMNRVHTPSSSIHRLEAAIKIYSALCNLTQRKPALDKLTRLLLHRYPKIRGEAADNLYICTGSASLVTCDWTAPVADLKPIVVRLRKQLGAV